MPKCCGYCPFEYKNYCMAKPSLAVESADRHPRCPLVPVPPHGRLIDADALYEVVKRRTRNWAGGWSDIKCVLTGNDIKNAPTIIPVKEGE